MTDRPVVDTARSVWIGDQLAAVVVQPDGTEVLWLLSDAEGAAEDTGCGCHRCAPHEQLTAESAAIARAKARRPETP